MDEETIKKIKESIGGPREITLNLPNGENFKFKLKPFKVKDLPKMMGAMNVFENINPSEKDMEKAGMAFLASLTEEKAAKIMGLAELAVRRSDPKLDDDTVDVVVANNWMAIITEVFDLNMRIGSDARQRLIADIKTQQK